MAVALGGVVDGVEDAHHDALELRVHFLEGPGEALGVLGHLQTGGGHAAGVGRLAREEHNAVLLHVLGSLEGGGHVGALGEDLAAVLHEILHVLHVHLVLGGAGQRDVAGGNPHAAALVVLDALAAGGILGEAAALHFLDLLEQRDIDARRIVHPTGGVGHGDHLGAELLGLLRGVDGHVAGAGDADRLAVEGVAVALQVLLHEVHQAVAGGLSAGERAAEGKALAG